MGKKLDKRTKKFVKKPGSVKSKAPARHKHKSVKKAEGARAGRPRDAADEPDAEATTPIEDTTLDELMTGDFIRNEEEEEDDDDEDAVEAGDDDEDDDGGDAGGAGRAAARVRRQAPNPARAASREGSRVLLVPPGKRRRAARVR